MKVKVITTPIARPAMVIADKETDLDLPGNRKWLMSHIRWALKFDYKVTIDPNL